MKLRITDARARELAALVEATTRGVMREFFFRSRDAVSDLLADRDALLAALRRALFIAPKRHLDGVGVLSDRPHHSKACGLCSELAYLRALLASAEGAKP